MLYDMKLCLVVMLWCVQCCEAFVRCSVNKVDVQYGKSVMALSVGVRDWNVFACMLCAVVVYIMYE